MTDNRTLQDLIRALSTAKVDYTDIYPVGTHAADVFLDNPDLDAAVKAAYRAEFGVDLTPDTC